MKNQIEVFDIKLPVYYDYIHRFALLNPEFQWDKGNSSKNWKKHTVSKSEAESVFFDLRKKVIQDLVGEYKGEIRHKCIGVSEKNRILKIIYTIRDFKIRIISAHMVKRKEKEFYEKA